MTTDLLGFGTNTANVISSRAADTRVFGTADTFAKDCSSPTAGDGTAIPASWAVGFLQQLRVAIRGNGQTAALVNIVTEDNTNDGMLLAAIQYLIQRGVPKFALDTGTTDNLVVALTPALSEYKQGVSIKVLVAHSNDGAAVINVNGLGNRNVLRKGGVALQPNDLAAGAIVTLDDDGTQFQLADMPAAFSNAARIVTSSATLTLALQDKAIALQRTTSVAAMNILLPAGGANGQTVEIEDVVGNLQGTTSATVIPDAGDTGGIAGAANYVMNRNFQSTKFRLYVSGSTRIWSRST